MTQKAESSAHVMSSTEGATSRRRKTKGATEEGSHHLTKPAALVSKEVFAASIGKTPKAVVEMAKQGKLPAFYMSDPQKPNGNAELWVNLEEWNKYAAALVEQAPAEWHNWKNRISHSKSTHK